MATPVNRATAYLDVEQMVDHQPRLKYFTLTLGTSGHVVGVVDEAFHSLGLQKVQNMKECDVIQTLCPVADFKAAVKMLNTLPGNKLAVLMLLHSTRDSIKDLNPDRFKLKLDMIAVDCLLCEDQGLLQCTENDEALSKMINWLDPEKISQRTSRNSLDVKLQKYFSLISGNTLNHDVSIERNLLERMPGLQQVKNVKESDLILHFCYVDSRAGTDIEAEIKMLSSLAGNKLAVLMLLHSTRDSIKDLNPDRFKLKLDMIAVDCLLCEDQGLLQCTENDEELSKMINWLDPEKISQRTSRNSLDVKLQKYFSLISGNTLNHDVSIERNLLERMPDINITSILTTKPPSLKYFTLISGKTLGLEMNMEKKLQEQYPGLQKVKKSEKSDLILVFCPVVSRAGTDIEAAMKMLSTEAGNKLAVLLVLHHTFDPNHIVPESSRAVKREKTIAVDFLFHEDQGLLTCSLNCDALSRVGKWLHHNKNNNQDVEKERHDHPGPSSSS